MREHRLSYRPEIDGLRAVAVLSVFTFHLNHKWLPGGFVGVDIFFVISGYLITSILYYDCEESRFSLARFYQRRIARIFPAFFTVAFATVVAAAFVYSPQDFASAGANLVASSLSVVNLKYMLQGNYFQISPDAQPFLHYWSLSVEEQFYMIFPLLLILIFRYARQALTPILSLLGAGSLVACVLVTYVNPAWAFYLLPTRAWELGTGGLLAIILSSRSESSVRVPHWTRAAGLLVIGGSFVFIHEGPHFPGWQAVFPVGGAAAIILSRSGSHDWAERWLSSGSMVKIGKMSYSLYLWHWPVFSLIDYRYYLLSVEMRFVLKVGLSFLLTFVTFRFIEVPARIFLNQPASRRIAFVTMAALVAFSVPLGVTIRSNNYVDASLADVAGGGLVFRGKPGGPSVVLMGDSNGSMYGKTMKEICAALCENLTVISVAAGDPLPPRRGEESSRLWLESLKTLRETKPDQLFLAAAWVAKLRNEPARLAAALNEIRPYVGHTILLNQPPILPNEANRSYIRDGGRPSFREAAETRAERHKINDLLLSFQSPSISVIDISRHFESEDGEVLFVDGQGRQMYQDTEHLSVYGTERVRDVLVRAISTP